MNIEQRAKVSGVSTQGNELLLLQLTYKVNGEPAVSGLVITAGQWNDLLSQGVNINSDVVISLMSLESLELYHKNLNKIQYQIIGPDSPTAVEPTNE